MSNILFLASPTLNALVDSQKGTTGNKIDCATKHFGNAFVTHTAGAAAIAGTALAGKIAANNVPEMAQKIAQMGPVKKFFTYLNAAPTVVKAIGGAAVAALALLYTYKTGKIEQKYLDRAQFVDHTFNLDDGGPNKVTSK